MRKQHYLPGSISLRRTWLNNFKTGITTVGAILGLTPAEIASIEADALAYSYMVDNVETFTGEFHERTHYLDMLANGEPSVPIGDLPGLPTLPPAPSAVAAGIFKRIGILVQRIKLHPNYTEAIGQSLGIVGAEIVIDYENIKVQITIRRTNAEGVALDFVKGQLDGVVVYGGSFVQNTSGQPEATIEPPVLVWAEIGRATKSPFVDNRPNAGTQPETRYYKMRYLKDDVPVGKDSDTISVIADLANKLK